MNISPQQSQFRPQMAMRGPTPPAMMMHHSPQGMPPTGHSPLHPQMSPMAGSPRAVMPQQQPLGQVPGQFSQHLEPKLDPISRAKSLVQPLKEQIVALSKAASDCINQSACEGRSESGVPKCEAVLEKIYAICDELELHLKTVHESLTQAGWSQRFAPQPVSCGKPDTTNPSEILSYNQYVNAVTMQLEHIESVKEILSADFCHPDVPLQNTAQSSMPFQQQQQPMVQMPAGQQWGGSV